MGMTGELQCDLPMSAALQHRKLRCTLSSFILRIYCTYDARLSARTVPQTYCTKQCTISS